MVTQSCDGNVIAGRLSLYEILSQHNFLIFNRSPLRLLELNEGHLVHIETIQSVRFSEFGLIDSGILPINHYETRTAAHGEPECNLDSVFANSIDEVGS